MKLIIVSVALAYLTSVVSSFSPECCPCGPKPEKPDFIEFVVEVPDSPQSNPSSVIPELLKLLIKNRIIDYPTATSILVTFRVPVPSDFPQNENPVTKVTINTLPIRGNPDVRDRFIRQLTNLLDRPSIPRLVKTLLELILNNKVATVPEIVTFVVTFGVVPDIQIVIRPEKVPQPKKTTPSYQQQTTPYVPIKPGKPTDSTVTITVNISPSDASPLVKYLIELLVKNNIVDKPTADRIVVTFIQNTGITAQPLKPYEPVTNVGGDPKPSKKFIDFIINLIRNPTSPSTPSNLVKSLLQLLIDNGVIDLPTASAITIKFNIPVRVTTVEPANDLPSIDEITNSLVPGKPSDSTITITQVLYPENLPTLISRLLQILVTRRIIDTPTANRILVTFRIPGAPDAPFNPNSARPLNPNDATTVVINGEPSPKDKFIQTIIKLLQNPSPQGKGPAQPLVKILLEFIVDNGIVDTPTALKILVKFGLGAQITVQQIRQSPESNLPNVDQIISQLVPGKPSDSTITITQVLYPENLPTFVNRLLQILVTRRIIDTPTANRILVTFRIPRAPDSPFNPSNASPLIPDDVSTTVINGEPFPKEKFIQAVVNLLRNPSSRGSAQPLVKILLEFVVDNGIADSRTALQILVKFGLGAQITIKDAPSYNPYQGALNPGQPGVSTVTVSQIFEEDVPAAVNGLLEILVSKNIIDSPTANGILVTFRLPGRGRLNPNGAQPLSPSSIYNIRINVDDAPAKKRFIDSLTSLVDNPVPSRLVQAILTLLLDSGTIDLPTAKSIMTVFRIGASIKFSYTPKPRPVQEPTLTPDPDRGANTQTDSTVTITQVVSDLKPFIVRLVQLSVQAGLFPQSVGSSILATFNVQAGGSVLSPSFVDSLTISGKDKGAKFIRSLRSLVLSAGLSSSQSGLVKILMELLIDNNVFGLRSASALLQAYNVGASVNVQYRSIQTSGGSWTSGGGGGGDGGWNFGGGGGGGFDLNSLLKRSGGNGGRQTIRYQKK